LKSVWCFIQQTLWKEVSREDFGEFFIGLSSVLVKARAGALWSGGGDPTLDSVVVKCSPPSSQLTNWLKLFFLGKTHPVFEPISIYTMIIVRPFWAQSNETSGWP